MKPYLLLIIFLSGIVSQSSIPTHAQTGIQFLVTGSRVTESLVPTGHSDIMETNQHATYSVIVENNQPYAQTLDVAISLPPGMAYLPETLRINGIAASPTTLLDRNQVRWQALELPAAHLTGDGNMAGVHVFLSDTPTMAEIDQRLAWAVHLVGRGGTIKLFMSSMTEHWTAPPEWMVYAVRRCYQLGVRPVVRLGFANGDAGSFTRQRDNPVGQMSYNDAIGGYWRLGWAMRRVVAELLAATASDAAVAPDAELTVIIGNEPNLEWVERDWFIDYSYVSRPDGSFDMNWLTTDPADPTAAANSVNGWRLFVRGIPDPYGPAPTYESRLDDYVHYLGYDAAVEYGRFLYTSSTLLQSLNDARLQIAAGAIASGGGDISGQYAYHQRHFIRRMLRTVPDALAHVDLWTTNNYPYTVPPWNNYHAHPADFDRYPLGEPFWHTEVGIDAYQGDLDYLAYLKRQGLATTVPSRAIIGEVGYGIGEGWGTAFDYAPITEDLRARYMADIFETYYNTWRAELVGVNLWNLGDPDVDRDTFHMFDYVYPDSQTWHGWPTHRHLMYDAVATRPSRPGAGRLIATFEVALDPDMPSGSVTTTARIAAIGADGASAEYTLQVFNPAHPPHATVTPTVTATVP